MAKYVSLSCTDNPLYSFFIPLVTWSWKKIGYDSIVFIPVERSPQFDTAMRYSPTTTRFVQLKVEPDREVTYFQCVRLYAAALSGLNEDDTIVTSDIDMAVFGNFFDQFTDGRFHVAGHDIAPPHQYPICYLAGPVKQWREIFHIREKDTPATMLQKLLGQIQCENMRGNYWAKDQETAYNCIVASTIKPVFHERSQPHHPTASNRADRDGWEGFKPGMIDAHLPRPGHIGEKYDKIVALLKAAYPHADLSWMNTYFHEYNG